MITPLFRGVETSWRSVTELTILKRFVSAVSSMDAEIRLGRSRESQTESSRDLMIKSLNRSPTEGTVRNSAWLKQGMES